MNHHNFVQCPVRPSYIDDLGEEAGDGTQSAEGEHHEEIEMEKELEEEARRPNSLREPGAPSANEVEEHNLTHLPFRAWCPSCVNGRGRDRQHLRQELSDKAVAEVVFDYCFMGNDGEETLAIQVARDRRTRMIFAHVVPRKGMSHEYGAVAMTNDLERLGYNEVILKCDNEPALRNVQEEVKARRTQSTLLENSPVGDSRSNGAAERAVQAVQEQVRVLRHGLEQRLGAKVSTHHPVMAWLVMHAADLISKFQVGSDGKTAYERLKGKPYKGEAVEYG